MYSGDPPRPLILVISAGLRLAHPRDGGDHVQVSFGGEGRAAALSAVKVQWLSGARGSTEHLRHRPSPSQPGSGGSAVAGEFPRHREEKHKAWPETLPLLFFFFIPVVIRANEEPGFQLKLG